MPASIYATDPHAAPDADFVDGQLRYLAIGNQGRLLDARRTPITVTAVSAEMGSFEVRIDAFEDAGARWVLPLADFAQFQFAREARIAPPDAVAGLERAVARFDRELVIECSGDARERTLARIARRRRALREQVAAAAGGGIELAHHVERRQGDVGLFGLVDAVMNGRDLVDLEREFSATLVTNPRSGEFVKAHAIVLAELGLCPYRGKVVRDPQVLEGPRSRSRRADHLVTRMALTQELWSSCGYRTVTLYRGAAVEGALPAPAPSSLVSATFSHDVAAAHFEGASRTQTAVLFRQQVPVTRLVMTFLETRELNERFREAEAVLVADPANRAF